MRHLAMIVVASSLMLAVARTGATSAALAAPAYELVVVPSVVAGNYSTFFRINVASGQVVYQSGNQFVVTTDSVTLPPGNYHLYRTESLAGKAVGAWTGWIPSQDEPGVSMAAEIPRSFGPKLQNLSESDWSG